MSGYQLQLNDLDCLSSRLNLHSNDEGTNETQGLSIDKNGNFPVYSDFLGVGYESGEIPFEMLQPAFPDGFGTSDSLILSARQSMSSFSGHSTPTLMTPGLLDSPSSSHHLASPAPDCDIVTPSWLTTPYPSLAGPSSSTNAIESSDAMDVSPSLNYPISGTSMSATTASPSPLPSSSGHIFKASPACPVVDPCHKSLPKKKKSRSSTAKATFSFLKAPEPTTSTTTSKVPCTVQGCSETFFNVQTRRRHVKNKHECVPGGLRFICPGKCKLESFSRKDALSRHLNTRDADSPCRIEAEKRGWSPAVRMSIEFLLNTPEDKTV